MNNKSRKNSIEKQAFLVKLWLATFIPFIISAVLFIFCFYFETEIWLYVICAAFFAVFVIMYLCVEKAIKQGDGYTLIQAMRFYLVCLKYWTEKSKSMQTKDIYGISKSFKFAENLNSGQVDAMYKIGGQLVRHFKLERFSRYV